MTDTSTSKPYTLESGEKATPVMIYTLTTLVRGEVVTREAVRINTWLRTQGAPDFVPVYDAHVLVFGGNGPAQTLAFPEYFISTPQIIAMHITPPAKEPPDYDPTEPNRKMEPVTLLVGTFRFNGHMRLASQMNLRSHMAIAREAYFSLYDVEITNTSMPSASALKVPSVLARLNAAFLAKYA